MLSLSLFHSGERGLPYSFSRESHAFSVSLSLEGIEVERAPLSPLSSLSCLLSPRSSLLSPRDAGRCSVHYAGHVMRVK